MSDNRGSQFLRETILVGETNQVVFAERIGKSQSFVSRLAAGGKPKLRGDALLLAKHGIAVEWWDQPPLHTKRPRDRRHSSAL